MRKPGFFYFCFLFIFTDSLPVLSQDLIVTKGNDSIHCKIKGIRGNDMLYDYHDTTQIRQSRISLSEMTYYHYGFYKNEKLISENAYALTKIRFGFTGGYSYRTAKANASIPSELSGYVNKLRSGYHFGGDVTVFVGEILGIGIRASRFQTGLKTEDNENISNNISIGFIGPSIDARFLDNTKKNFVNVAFSLGYMGYKDQMEIGSYNLMKGSTIGCCVDLGYDIRLSQKWAFGLQLSGLAGRIKKIRLSDDYSTEEIKLEKQNYEGLARLDFSIGLRCSL